MTMYTQTLENNQLLDLSQDKKQDTLPIGFLARLSRLITAFRFLSDQPSSRPNASIRNPGDPWALR
jgi:hypothetical protein